MIDHEKLVLAGREPDPVFVQLVEQITQRLQAGEEINVREYVRRYPQWASAILSLLPTMHDLVDLGWFVDRDRRGGDSNANTNDANGHKP
jgi:hypothetical protein